MAGRKWRNSLVVLVSVYLIAGNAYFVCAMNKMPPPPAKLYKGFSRQCSVGEDDCKFTAQDSAGNSLYFKCRESVCFCSRGSAPEDELVWPVTWDKSEKCLVGKGGPCGEDNGLSVGCMQDLSCIQGRCRNTSEIHGGRLHQFCNDDVDCQSGLSCHHPPQNMEIRIRRCLTL